MGIRVQPHGQRRDRVQPVRMKQIFAGMLALVALLGALPTAYVLTDRIDATVHKGLTTDLVTGVRSRMAEIGGQMEHRLEHQSEHTVHRVTQAFEKEKLAIAKGLVNALLPMVENFDLEAVEEITRETLRDAKKLKGVQIRTARDGPWQRYGNPEHIPGRSFKALGTSQFGYVEVQLRYDIRPLQASIDIELEAVGTLVSQYQLVTRDTISAIQQQAQLVEETLSRTNRWWIGLSAILSASLLMLLVLLLLDRLVVRPLRGVVQLFRQIAEGSIATEDFPNGEEASGSARTAEQIVITQLRERLGWSATRTRELVEAAEQMVAILIDRKKAEARVRRSLEAAQAILESAPVGMAIVGQDKIVRQINDTALEMMGKTRQSIVGHSCNHSMCPAQEERCPVLDLGQEVDASEKTVCGVRGEIPVIKTVVPITLHDEPVLLEAFIDISERKKNELALVVARREAESASRVKSAFLANMSHEIRTPMNGVLGMAELLENTGLTAEQRRFTGNIQRSGEVLLNIINDILDFSKIEAGKMELERVSFDIRELVEDIGEVMAEPAHKKGLELGCIVAVDMPQTYRGDPVRLRQILINLVNNAVKFTEQGQVELRVLCLETDPRDAVLKFEVRDTGIGVSEAERAHLFNAFSQADPSTTRRFGGTGLGLTISKRLVTMMQGDIGVESTHGYGSTFWFTVRLSQADDLSIAARDSIPHVVRVLVVSGNELIRESLDNHLQGLKATGLELSWSVISKVQDAQACLTETTDRGAGFDLVIVDWDDDAMVRSMLPYQALKEAGREKPKIAYLYADNARLQERDSEMDDAIYYLPKPLRRSAIRDCLVAVAHGRSVSEPTTAHIISAQKTPELHARVLLAEDQLVNQEVVYQMLSVLGCEVVVAGDGQAALEALTESEYNMVLMDCSMPNLDGYEATAEIRRREREAGLTPVPVIALTANALRGDREQCLAAGMDDYLSKPVSTGALRKMLERWLPATDIQTSDTIHGDGARHDRSNADAAEQGATSSLDAEVMAEIRALDSDGSGEFLRGLAAKYAKNWARDFQALQDNIQQGDAESARKLAHRLKSSSASLGALPLAKLCQQLESALRASRLEGHENLMARMSDEHEHVNQELNREWETAA